MTKAYTDLEQSKRLAEFLPIESADGYWFKGFPAQPYMVYTTGTPNPGEHIPCWSLVALLGVIAFPVLSQREDGGWEAWSFPKHSLGEVSIQDDPIDACVDLIISLNSNK